MGRHQLKAWGDKTELAGPQKLMVFEQATGRQDCCKDIQINFDNSLGKVLLPFRSCIQVRILFSNLSKLHRVSEQDACYQSCYRPNSGAFKAQIGDGLNVTQAVNIGLISNKDTAQVIHQVNTG